MNWTAWAVNSAWMLKCARCAAAYRRATRCVASTQKQLLRQTLQANRASEFGLRYRFESIADARAFQARVPLATYDDFSSSVARIAAGEPNVLMSEAVRLLEPTSGSSGGEKLIPYTTGLRRQFQRAIETWIHDLYLHRPAVRRGRAYWSVSPSLMPRRRTAGGIPIGFADDTAYLGPAMQCALRRVLVAPASVGRLTDTETFRYCTMLLLLAAADMTLISVWSPTFLTSLMESLDSWQERLCDDLRRGAVTPPGPDRCPQLAELRRHFRPHVARAEQLRRAMNAGGSLGDRLRGFWPELALISCWCDAGAAQFVPLLRALFPGVEVQPKGLLATECFVSIPQIGSTGGALAVDSHFFEFEAIEGDCCLLAHELELGGRYRVVVTTAGGLYRYRLGDEIEIVGFLNECPLVRFIGRGDVTCDIVGEKLSEPHVRRVIAEVLVSRNIPATFAMLAPVVNRRPRYRLFIQAPGLTAQSPQIGELRDALEQALSKNPYYQQALGLAQLGPLEVAALSSHGESAWRYYERRRMADGTRCGAVKPVALDGRTDWPDVFQDLL